MIAKHIGAALRAVGPALADGLETVVFLVGAALISYGAWLASQPAGFIVGGVLLIAGALLRERGA